MSQNDNMDFFDALHISTWVDQMTGDISSGIEDILLV